MTTENLENKIGFQIGFLLYSNKSPQDTIESLIGIAKDYANSKWIKIENEANMPKPDQDVLVLLDHTEYGRGKRIEKARVHFTEQSIAYGGPNALTGSGMLKGTFFSIPAILNPKTVTHWMPLPELPN